MPSISSMPAGRQRLQSVMPRVWPASCASFHEAAGAPGPGYSIRSATRESFGINLFQSNSSRFPLNSGDCREKPSDVAARSSKAFNKPGAYRVRNSCHDDQGIVFVEFFAALIAGVETATIRSTLERTSSLAISGRRSSFSSA